MLFTSIFISVLLVFPCTSAQYDMSNVIPGVRMSVNDDMFVSASNSFSNFAVLMHPFRNETAGGPIRCNMRYNDSNRFVHSVSVAGIAKYQNDSEIFLFVFAAEHMPTAMPYVCIGTIAKSTCISRSRCTNFGPAGVRQEYFLVAVDTNGVFAYGFTSTFVFKLDIYRNEIVANLSIEAIWPKQGFIPHALDVSDDWAVVAGYGYTDSFKKNYAALGCYVNLTSLSNAACVGLVSEPSFLIPANVVSYNELYELSVAIRGEKILVGVHRLETVVVLHRRNSTIALVRTHRISYPEALSFARVVDWADDSTIAVLVLDPGRIPWARSQIFVFHESSVNSTLPVFLFPNNQQIIGTRLSRPTFARFGITQGGNMAILTGNADILVIPVSPAGHASRWIDTTERVFVFYYKPQLCIGGTYKNQTSLGPCQICPPRTRNPGTESVPILQCRPCSFNSSTSFCPLASLADVDPRSVPTYSQAVAYPESSDITDVEDILIKNMFQISSEQRCLVISPLLWTLVVSGLCALIIIFMLIIKACKFERFDKYRRKLKNIFKHTDIIGEGEMWVGGLATLAIVVLVSFSYWFSASFIRRYPIEEVNAPATFACDLKLLNAQFSSGLDLLALPKSEEAQPIFNLLEEQTFVLTLELINTGFSCDMVTAQENLIDPKYVPLPAECYRTENDALTSVTVRLPRHITTIQMNMTGPFWIGGIRLCIRGHGFTNHSVTLRTLDFCEFYSTSNEAIGRTTVIPIEFIRNINITQALQSADPTRYSGLWMPTFSRVSLSDEAYYVEFGNYLRYTSALTIVKIILDERPFYIKNIQQPIVRTAELVFHGLLFTSLCIELFAFTFLIIKLFLLPLSRLLLSVWNRFRHGDSKSNASDESMVLSMNKYQSNNDTTPWQTQSETELRLRNDFSNINEKPMKEQKQETVPTDDGLKTSQVFCRF